MIISKTLENSRGGCEDLRVLMLMTCLTLAMVMITACGDDGKSDSATIVEDRVQPDIPLLTAVDYGLSEMVLVHMEYGTDPNEAFIPEGLPFAGASALHLAVLKNNEEVARLLLENGADIEIKARDEFEATPLIWAAYWGLYDMAKLLLEEGANVNATDSYGSTPLVGASVENPFIDKDDVKGFIENREKIRALLKENGGTMNREG